jgi:hypothetical protein
MIKESINDPEDTGCTAEALSTPRRIKRKKRALKGARYSFSTNSNCNWEVEYYKLSYM